MAIVDSGTGRTPAGTSRAAGTFYQGGAFQGSPRTAAPPPVTGTSAALGLTPEEIEARQKQTGVNPGGTGYVSGQVAPSGQAMKALGAATSGPANPGESYNPLTRTGGAMATTQQPNGGQRSPGTGDTTTTTGALTTGGGAPPPAGSRASSYPPAAPPPGDTSTRTGALTSGPTGSPSTAGPQGMTPAPNRTGVVTNAPIATTGNATADRILDPGGLLSGPAYGDTGPAMASQAAGFGLSDDFSRERYDYRPGEAASQNRVEMDRADANAIRAQQLQALQSLTDAANGNVPSAAELQMRREAGRNVAATLGQARALGGRSAGGAARAGTLASADILSRGNLDAAQLRAQEQDVNRRNLQQALGMTRGQDESAAESAARLEQEANANNLRAQLEQNQLAEQHRQALIDAQLKALGLGTSAGNAVVQGGAANAGAQNRFQSGILGAVGDAF